VSRGAGFFPDDGIVAAFARALAWPLAAPAAPVRPRLVVNGKGSPMRRKFILYVPSLALGLSAVGLHGVAMAQTAPPPDVAGAAAANAGPQIVVVADRTPEALDQVGQSVTVLTLPQIRADQELTVSDILDRIPGVSFARNGGVGETTSLYIRGAEADQTATVIDGVKLNDPSAPGGGFNFGDLLVSDIARIEVLRGPQSTLYGSQAIGGVVNIVTADPTQRLQGDAQVEGGTYDTLYVKGGIGGKDGPWTWRVAANAYSTTGVSAFDKRLGGIEPDGYRNQGVTGRLAYQVMPDVSLDLRGIYIQARSKFDGYSTPDGAFGDDNETGTTRESIAYAGLNFGLLDDRLQNRVAAQYTLTQRDDSDPADAPITKTFDGRGTNVRVEYQGTYLFAPGWQGVFGAETEREAITTSSPAFDAPGTAPTKADDTISSGYGQLKAEPIKDLTLAGGLRYDDHSTFGGHVVGQASAAWSLNQGNTILRASWGQGFKAPSLYELYSAYGNTALRPEEATGWDGGVEQRLWSGRIDLQATFFHRDTDHLIEFADCASVATPQCADGRYGFYENINKATAEGVELTADVKPVDGLDLNANYTYLDDKNRSPGADFNDDLPRRPDNTANLTASYVWPIKLMTAAAMRYAGASFDDDANLTRLKSYTLVDLRAAYPLGRGLEVYGRIENLFDRAYETAFQYGSLGRAAYAGVRASF
jgi:vitamin B12 transporter